MYVLGSIFWPGAPLTILRLALMKPTDGTGRDGADGDGGDGKKGGWIKGKGKMPGPEPELEKVTLKKVPKKGDGKRSTAWIRRQKHYRFAWIVRPASQI